MDVAQWLEIRRRVLREGVSKRQILRETGMHWGTLKKILAHPCPPGYQRRRRPPKPKIDPYRERIAEILEADKLVHKKQRHTAKRIWERLQEEGFTGGYSIVKEAVQELKRTSQQVYMPLTHPPGEAQVDFGYGAGGGSGSAGATRCDTLAPTVHGTGRVCKQIAPVVRLRERPGGPARGLGLGLQDWPQVPFRRGGCCSERADKVYCQ